MPVIETLLLGLLGLNGLLVLTLMAVTKFWAAQVQLLTDKLMSRDFHSYQQSAHPPPRAEFKLPAGEPEDLGVLPHFALP